MPVTRFTGCMVRLSNRRGGRRWQVDGGWRQLTRVWEQHALRCVHEGGHVFAFQHLGQKMSTHSGSTWKRPSGGSRRQKSGWGSCLFGRTGASSLGRFRQPAAATTSREAFRLGASLKYVEEGYTKARGGGRAAGPHLRELLNGAKQNVQTEPNLPVGGQEIGQKKHHESQASPGEGLGHWAALSHARSMRCEGSQLRIIGPRSARSSGARRGDLREVRGAFPPGSCLRHEFAAGRAAPARLPGHRACVRPRALLAGDFAAA